MDYKTIVQKPAGTPEITRDPFADADFLGAVGEVAAYVTGHNGPEADALREIRTTGGNYIGNGVIVYPCGLTVRRTREGAEMF